MKSNAENMKTLRQYRAIRKECIRCGSPLDHEGYKTCSRCRDYMSIYKKDGSENEPNTTYFYTRNVNLSKVKKRELYDHIIKRRISLKSLASEVGLSTRTIENLLYTDRKYNKRTKELINSFFNKEIL